MNYYRAIKAVYPDIEDHQFGLCDRGDGIQLAHWDYPGEPPDLRTLQSLANTFEEIYRCEKTIQQLITQQLQPTDWYYLRYLRTGKAVPKGIKENNAAVYEEINRLQAQVTQLLAQANATPST